MPKRQAVIVLESSHHNLALQKYGVRYRERGFWPWSWTDWMTVSESNPYEHAWEYTRARFIADQILNNGVVLHTIRSGACQAIVELDEE